MKILITGGKGTLGSKLVIELESRGHDVWTCDLAHSDGQHIRCDVSESRQVASLFDRVKPEVCYHLAAEFGRVNGQHYPEQLWKTNCLGTRNVIESCVAHKTTLVFASSSEAYGDIADEGILYESSLDIQVPKFHNEYALTKWTNEKQIQTAIANEGLKAVVLRFFNAYGPGEKYSDYRSVVCLFVYRLLKGLPITVYQNYHRAFMHVDDWSRTVANVTDRLDRIPNGSAYNVAGFENKSIEELVEAITSKIGGTKSVITLMSKEKANITDKFPYNDKAAFQLGHRCDITLDAGLDDTIAWMKDEYGL